MAISAGASMLDAMVLSVVSREDTYGYKITQDVRQAMEVSESTLYPVLRRLQKDGLLEVYDREYSGRNRRYYRITGKGRTQLIQSIGEWEQYKEKIDNLFFGGDDNE